MIQSFKDKATEEILTVNPQKPQEKFIQRISGALHLENSINWILF